MEVSLYKVSLLSKKEKIILLFQYLQNNKHYGKFFTFICTLRIVIVLRLFKIQLVDFILCPNLITIKGRKNYFNVRRFVYFAEHINEQDQLYLLRDKHIALQRLRCYIDRKWIYLLNADQTEVNIFLSQVNRFVLKPVSKAGGLDIVKGEVSDNLIHLTYQNKKASTLTISDFYQLYKSNDVLLEEYISQHPCFNKIFSGCINSIRIHTLNVNGNIEVVGLSSVRFGSGKDAITDFQGGITIGINPNGRLYPYDCYGQYTSHPDSMIVFKNIIIPYWSECLNMALAVAKEFPELNYIGWDLALTPEGPTIIEGNGSPASYSVEQKYSLNMNGTGILDKEKNFLQNTIFRKNLSLPKIKEINTNLFYASSKEQYSDINIVVILGSAKCKYRVLTAFNLYRNKDVIYVVSGKNECVYINSDGFKQSEAEFMSDYLVSQGVCFDKIWMENQSGSTAENVDYVFKMLKCKNISKDIKIAVVTGGFHMQRVRNEIKKNKYSKEYKYIVYVPAYGEHTKPDNWFKTNLGTEIILNELKSTIS